LFFVDAPTKELLETPADGTGGTVLIAGPSADWETDAVTVSFAAGNAKGNSSGTEAGQMAAPPVCNAGSPVAVDEPRKGLSGVALGRTRGAALIAGPSADGESGGVTIACGGDAAAVGPEIEAGTDTLAPVGGAGASLLVDAAGGGLSGVAVCGMVGATVTAIVSLVGVGCETERVTDQTISPPATVAMTPSQMRRTAGSPCDSLPPIPRSPRHCFSSSQPTMTTTASVGAI
jgi:hypothetical protein